MSWLQFSLLLYFYPLQFMYSTPHGIWSFHVVSPRKTKKWTKIEPYQKCNLSFEITIMDILEGKYILICCPEIPIIAIWNNRIQNDPISPEKFLVKQKHNHWPRNLLFTNIPLPLPLWFMWTTFFRRMWVTAYQCLKNES